MYLLTFLLIDLARVLSDHMQTGWCVHVVMNCSATSRFYTPILGGEYYFMTLSIQSTRLSMHLSSLLFLADTWSFFALSTYMVGCIMPGFVVGLAGNALAV